MGGGRKGAQAWRRFGSEGKECVLFSCSQKCFILPALTGSLGVQQRPLTNLVEHNFWLQVKILNFAADYSWLTHVGQEYDSKRLACQVSTLRRHIRLARIKMFLRQMLFQASNIKDWQSSKPRNSISWDECTSLSICLSVLPGSRTFFWALQVYSSWNDSAFPEQKLSPPKQAAWSSNSCLRIWRLRQTQFRNILEILKKKWTSKGHGYAPMCVTQFFTTSPLGIEKCLPFLNAHQNPHGCSIVAVQW